MAELVACSEEASRQLGSYQDLLSLIGRGRVPKVTMVAVQGWPGWWPLDLQVINFNCTQLFHLSIITWNRDSRKYDNANSASTQDHWLLSNALKIFHDTVLVLEREDGTVCELYDMMFTLKTKLQLRQSEGFFGAQTDVLLQQFPDRQLCSERTCANSTSPLSPTWSSAMTSQTPTTRRNWLAWH